MHLDGDFRGFEAIKGTTVNNRERHGLHEKARKQGIVQMTPAVRAPLKGEPPATPS